MTALLALVGSPLARDTDATRALMGCSTRRGGETYETWSEDDVFVAISQPVWQRWDHDQPPIAISERFVVVADATLYYRDDFARRLPEHVGPEAQSPALAILRALEKWGNEGVQRLEGDFAFIAWDRKERRTIAARDFAGTRPLFHTRVGDGVAIASSLVALSSLPGKAQALNLACLIEEAACLDFNFLEDTVFQEIRRLPAGFILEQEARSQPSVRQFWQVPIFERGGATSFEEGADELRELLVRAVAERLDAPSRPSSIWLSGGYDSTSLFGAGSLALSRDGHGALLRPVSYSHPEGDEGREDELIEAVTGRWANPPHWLGIDSVPPFDDPMGSAGRRDEPFSHPYERWNRWLAEGTRTIGGRVAISGNGGDQFFSVTPIFLADLVRSGRIVAARRAWRERFGTFRFRSFFKFALQPNLPSPALAIARAIRGGRPLQHYFHRRVAPWFRQDALATHQIAERASARPRRRPGESHSAWEHAWFLRSGFGERVNALASAFALDQGVEVRMPLYDERVIRFAATRPRWESNSGGENKRLLRGSMRGVLPEEVIGRRARRTGIPSTYFARASRELLASSLRYLRSEAIVADLGLVDLGRLRSTIEDYLEGRLGDAEIISALMYTTQSEMWLRSFYKSGRPEMGTSDDSK